MNTDQSSGILSKIRKHQGKFLYTEENSETRIRTLDLGTEVANSKQNAKTLTKTVKDAAKF